MFTVLDVVPSDPDLVTSSGERVLVTKSGWPLNRGQIPLISYIGGKSIMSLNRVGPLFSDPRFNPYLVPPDLVTPRFSDRINFPRYRKLTVFDPDLVPNPI
eukprot:sb/3478487/